MCQSGATCLSADCCLSGFGVQHHFQQYFNYIMAVCFFLKIYNQVNSSVVNNICNTICLQFLLYRVPLESLGLFFFISSRIGISEKCVNSISLNINDPSWLSSDTSIKGDGVVLVYSRFSYGISLI
jgi:hypothetical protein